ncbi:MAG: hypothetical protein RIS29_2905, partial [Bacteroidota bacterium]
MGYKAAHIVGNQPFCFPNTNACRFLPYNPATDKR